MLDTLKGLIASKKAVAAFVAVLMSLFGKKMGIDEDSLTKVVGAIVGYVLAQGVADFGKSSAQVKASA